MINQKIANDLRIDPRIREFLQAHNPVAMGDVASREELLTHANLPEVQSLMALVDGFMGALGNESVAPHDGLKTETLTFESQPDGNSVKIQYIRPDTDEVLPCVYYIHGGGMMLFSCFYENYAAWGRMLAAQGVAVAMVDFRNSLYPSSAEEVAPFPAGLNDCVSGLRWLHANAASLNVDPQRVIVSGESGGGNLAIATALTLKQENSLELIKGVYALCPFIAGEYPLEKNPSSSEFNGVVLELFNNSFRMAYGIDAFESANPLAWPGFATEDDVRGLPPVVISVNECDPLRDEGINFYRLLMNSGVSARCRQVMGTVHAVEIMPVICPEISRDTARDLAGFCRDD